MKYIPGKKLFHRIQRQYPKNDPRVILETKKQITAQYRKIDRNMAPLLMKRLRKLKQHGLYNQNIMLPLLISVLMGIFGSAVVNLIEKVPQGPPLVSLLVSLLVLPLFICPTLAILLWMILAYGRSTAYSEYELYIRPFECKLLENRIRQLTKMDLSLSLIHISNSLSCPSSSSPSTARRFWKGAMGIGWVSWKGREDVSAAGSSFLDARMFFAENSSRISSVLDVSMGSFPLW